MKNSLVDRVLNMTITAGAVVLIGAGSAYCYFSGSNNSLPRTSYESVQGIERKVSAETPRPAPKIIAKPVQVSQNEYKKPVQTKPVVKEYRASQEAREAAFPWACSEKERDCALEKRIKKHEGFRSKAYRDTRGNLTIGDGFNLNKEGAKQEIESLGLNYKDVRSRKQGITKEQAEILMKKDIATAKKAALRYLPNLHELHPTAQEIIDELAYTVGGDKLMDFDNTRQALEKGDYKGAAYHLQHSDWYKQTKSRGVEIVGMMMAIQ